MHKSYAYVAKKSYLCTQIQNEIIINNKIRYDKKTFNNRSHGHRSPLLMPVS